MIQSATLAFLKGLGKNNNKSWFDQHRPQYEEAKEDVIALVTNIIAEIGKFDPPIGALNPKDCLFRINRDVRFSKDKSPYKTRLAAYFNKGGKKSNGAGYYMHIEPGESIAAGGIWSPEPADLNSIRQEIDYNFAEWKKMNAQSGFKKLFPEGVITEDSLTRAPKGFEEDNPAIRFIKMKNFFVARSFNDKDVMDRSYVKQVAATFKAIKPLVDFINRAVD